MELTRIIGSVGQIYISWGYLIVFLGSLIETSPLGFTIPGGLIVALGGFYAFSENISLALIVVSSTLGMLATFLMAYYLGKRTGYKVVKRLKQEKNAERARVLLEKNGPTILTTSLLSNLTRFWVAYVAGAQEYNIFKFSFYALVASLTWNSLFVVVGYLAGSSRGKLESGLARLGIVTWALVMIAGFVIYWKNKQEYKDLKS